MSAEAAAAGDSKMPLEAAYGADANWRDAGPVVAQDTSTDEPTGSVLHQADKGSSQKLPRTLHTMALEHERLAAGISP